MSVTTPDPPPFWAGALVGGFGYALVAGVFLPRIPRRLRATIVAVALLLSLWGANSA